jgi:hypothetical protein
MVVVNGRQRSSDYFILVGLFGDEMVAYWIAHSFRAVLVAIAGDGRIKFRKQLWIDRESGSR